MSIFRSIAVIYRRNVILRPSQKGSFANKAKSIAPKCIDAETSCRKAYAPVETTDYKFTGIDCRSP